MRNVRSETATSTTIMKSSRRIRYRITERCYPWESAMWSNEVWLSNTEYVKLTTLFEVMFAVLLNVSGTMAAMLVMRYLSTFAQHSTRGSPVSGMHFLI